MPDASKLALIIGIDSYHNNLEPLPSCRKDAKDIAELLSQHEFNYTIFKGKPLIGSELDNRYGWADLRNAIFQFFGEAKPGQKLLFYFSGHGIPGDNDVYLATPQIDPKNPGSAGFSLSELTKRMSSSKSQHLLGIIDACYSGSTELPDLLLKKKAAKDNVGRALATYDRIWNNRNTPKSKAIYLMLSSQSYEPSNAVEGSNSLYTRFLLEGLGGIEPKILDEKGNVIDYSGSIEHNGEVTPNSLHDYVYHKVANMTDQVPVIKSIESRRFAIVNYPQLAKKPQTSQRDYLLQLLLDGKIKEFNEMRKKDDYKPIDLNEVTLREKDLQGTNLRYAHLQRSDLRHSNLTKVDLSNANLTRADLSNANLTGSRLIRSDLSKTNLNMANISGADLSHTNAHYANFSNCSLAETIFRDSQLYRANLSGADLSNSILYKSDLNKTKFRGANLTNADLSNCSASNVFLIQSNLTNAKLRNAHLWHANLTGANLTNADLSNSNLSGARIMDCKEYHNLVCNDADFSGAYIESKEFQEYLRSNKAKNVSTLTYGRAQIESKGGGIVRKEKVSVAVSIKDSMSVIDLTDISGWHIQGPVTNWQIVNGSYILQHIAGMTPDGELVLFSWSLDPNKDLKVVNISELTGQKIAGPVTSWQTTDGSYKVEHLAAVGKNQDLMVFSHSLRHDWQLEYNISELTGQKIAGPVTSWQIIEEDEPYILQHIAGMTPDGELVEFIQSPRHDLITVYISDLARQKIAGPVTSWQMPEPGEWYPAEYLASIDPHGELVIFCWSPSHDWQLEYNISELTGQKIAGPVTSWQIDNNEYLAAPGIDNSLLVFNRTDMKNWSFRNVTKSTTNYLGQVIGQPVFCQLPEGYDNIEMLCARGLEGSLWLYSRKPSYGWESTNLSTLTEVNSEIASDPTTWLINYSNTTIAYLAVEASSPNRKRDNKLLVISLNPAALI